MTTLTDEEKQLLKGKIFSSISRLTQFKKRASRALVTAAMITLTFIAFYGYFYQSPKTSITEFVRSTESRIDIGSDKVTLVLGQNENWQIDEEVANIDYSDSGRKVRLGITTEVNQEVSKNSTSVYNTLFVPYGKRSRLKLSDGSTVWLNSGSKMVYPAAFTGNTREVYLEGEAIFDVAHDKDHPFIVLSEDHKIEVLGTVFGVTNYTDENSIKTVLKSGSVQISYDMDSSPFSNDNDKVRITPGTAASYNKKRKSIQSEKINVDHYFSWREGVLIFKNDDLASIMKRIARYYNVSIDVSRDASTKETFSGYLDLNENIEVVLENIKGSTNIGYEINEDKILITNN